MSLSERTTHRLAQDDAKWPSVSLVVGGLLVLTLGIGLAAWRFVRRGFRWPCEMSDWGSK